MGVLGTETDSISQQGNQSMMQPNNISMMQMMNVSQLTENNHHSSLKNLGQSQMTHEKNYDPSTLGNTSLYMGKVKTESK